MRSNYDPHNCGYGFLAALLAWGMEPLANHARTPSSSTRSSVFLRPKGAKT